MSDDNASVMRLPHVHIWPREAVECVEAETGVFHQDRTLDLYHGTSIRIGC